VLELRLVLAIGSDKKGTAATETAAAMFEPDTGAVAFLLVANWSTLWSLQVVDLFYLYMTAV
jgi:hypothetical protein